MLRATRANERGDEVLRALKALLPGDVRGYVVRGDDSNGYRFDAQTGYSAQLLELTPGHGPWRSPGPRLVANNIAEMFTPNEQALRAQYADLGLRDANSTMVVPVAGRFASYGTLVLHRHGPPAFGEDELKQVARWGSVLGETQAKESELGR